MHTTEIARIAHEVNRAYCQALGDNSQISWLLAPKWQVESAILGVEFHQQNPNAGPEASHESWMVQKVKEGWGYGPEKNPELKQHPCMMPFDQLPREQQAKDYIFQAVVRALLPVTTMMPDIGDKFKIKTNVKNDTTINEYSAIGCLDTEHTGPAFIKHFYARDNEQALMVAEWAILNAGDVVGVVVVGHSLSLDPQVTAEPVNKFVENVNEQLARSKAELAHFSSTHICTSQTWFHQHILILEEYLTWYNSVKTTTI